MLLHESSPSFHSVKVTSRVLNLQVNGLGFTQVRSCYITLLRKTDAPAQSRMGLSQHKTHEFPLCA